MDERTLEQLCRLYSLGQPAQPPERVFGGLMHRLYHIHTQRGEFAVKVLNPDVLTQPDIHSRLRLSERIAATVAAAGLPAVAALEARGDVLQEVGPLTTLVYPWVYGRPLSSAPAGPRRARKIGEILGRIHGLGLRFPELEPSPIPGFSDAEWERMADEAENQQMAWAVTLRKALPDLSRWGQALAEAQRTLPERWAVSHADLHQQNVLWSNEFTPWLIDWEGAGLQQPAKEAVVCALEWSGFVEGQPDLATFRAFLQAYRREAPLPAEEAALGLRACFGNWLGWLRFCVGRTLGGTDPDDRAEGARQVIGTLATVRRAEANFAVLEAASRG